MSLNQDEFALVYSLAKDELRQKRLNLRENNSSSRQILIKKLILVIKQVKPRSPAITQRLLEHDLTRLNGLTIFACKCKYCTMYYCTIELCNIRKLHSSKKIYKILHMLGV